MEKFFKINSESDLYRKYFDFIDMSKKFNEIYKEFAQKHEIESHEYYQSANRLCICPTEKDKERFKGMFCADSYTDFKKTAPICKEWAKLCKENKIETPRKPSVAWDTNVNLNSNRSSQRLFHIGNMLIGSIDNKCDEKFDLSSEFEEIKASEFYKIVEESEEKQ